MISWCQRTMQEPASTTWMWSPSRCRTRSVSSSARRPARAGCQMKSWMSALAAMSMKLAAPRVGWIPSMKSDVVNP